MNRTWSMCLPPTRIGRGASRRSRPRPPRRITSMDSKIDERLMPLMYLAVKVPTEDEVLRWGDNVADLCEMRRVFIQRLALPVAVTMLTAGMTARRELIRWLVDDVRPAEMPTPENEIEKSL